MLKTIILCLLITLAASCKRVEPEKDWPKEKPSATENPEQAKSVKVPLDDHAFFVVGKPYKVNGLDCHWEYKVRFIEYQESTDQYVRVLRYELINNQTKKAVFTTENEVAQTYSPIRLSLLKDYAANIDCEDINNDSYCDFAIVTEIAAAGSNTSKEAFLYDPKWRKFIHSDVFTGTNVEYDKRNNRISSMWKNGGGDYDFTYLNLSKDKKTVAFIENVHLHQDTLDYKKMVANDLITNKKIVLKGHVDSPEAFLERKQ